MTTGYALTNHYGGQGLLDSFSFFTGIDPSHGFVDYQSKEDALAQNLVYIDHDFNNVILGVDSNNTYSTSDKGRPSVRLTSHDTFSQGLFVADFHHMPASTCGTWPAFWAFNNQQNGTDWPVGGELEIIEGANTADRNLFSAHTTEGCHAPKTGFSGEQGLENCSPSPENLGCSYASPRSDTTSYGDSSNAEGGGVYALLWDSEDLKLWHFPRSTIPDDITYGHVVGPDPSSWGPPHAIFGGSDCKAENYFFNMSLVININFCGDYAGNIWGKADQCNQLAPTCEEFVANNPHSFQEAYWDINYIDVYQYGLLTNTTVPPLSPNITSSVTPSISSATPVPRDVAPTLTRTITLSTILPVETESSMVELHPVDSNPPEASSVGSSPVNGYTLLGCFEVGASHDSFTQVSSHPGMDNGACVAACAGRKYAGVHDDVCYCADTLGHSTVVGNDMCDTPCKGNGDESCGGSVASPEPTGSSKFKINSAHNLDVSTPASQNHRRSAPTGVLLTVYANLENAPCPWDAPAMGRNSMDFHPDNVVVTTALTVTYTTVCPTNPATLVEVEYATTATYEDCGCTATKAETGRPPVHFMNVTATIPTTPITAVPMTTHVEPCRACGPHGENTVTLTIPEAVVPKVVTSIAVHTVVPVINNISNKTIDTAPIPETAVPFTPIPRPNDSPSPMIAAAPRSSSMIRTMGWGIAIWFALFGFMVVL
ncbi:glycoside hydrolase family 16 protein [Rostrohypoxylon terebratum]|nr:glycoside hydrolase family 16 protein [Rostrohypoxylon terebratum]